MVLFRSLTEDYSPRGVFQRGSVRYFQSCVLVHSLYAGDEDLAHVQSHQSLGARVHLVIVYRSTIINTVRCYVQKKARARVIHLLRNIVTQARDMGPDRMLSAVVLVVTLKCYMS